MRKKRTAAGEKNLTEFCANIAAVFAKSPYSMSAVGMRNVSSGEVADVFRALLAGCSPDDLKRLYDEHPATIVMEEEQKRYSCPDYSRGRCQCFLPNGECRITKRNKERRDSAEYAQWRTRVFERDDFVCQNCGKRGGRLNAHHIKGFAKYPDLRTDLDNGITLCEECHRFAHKMEASNV